MKVKTSEITVTSGAVDYNGAQISLGVNCRIFHINNVLYGNGVSLSVCSLSLGHHTVTSTFFSLGLIMVNGVGLEAWYHPLVINFTEPLIVPDGKITHHIYTGGAGNTSYAKTYIIYDNQGGKNG